MWGCQIHTLLMLYSMFTLCNMYNLYYIILNCFVYIGIVTDVKYIS